MPTKTAKTDTMLYIKGHRKWYVASFAVALVVFAWAAYVAHKGAATGWEHQLFWRINGWPDKWEHVFVAISLAGGSVWAAVAAVGVTFFLKMYRLCWRMSVSVIGAYAVAFLAKHFIDRGRPEAVIQDVHQRVAESGMGFPSGHATLATVITLTILPYLPKRWRWIPPVWILLVVLSRLYLGVHLPLDVIGGVCVGIVIVAFIRIMPQPLRVFLRLD
jgi:undecaprenyl-diphosphatase